MSEPITTALRGLLCAKPKGDACWDAMDAVDAVHAALEAENEALRAKVEELDNVVGSMHDGGSITDELRAVAAKTECANGRCEKLYRGDLDHIADRIDAEHERLMQEQPFTIDMVPMTDEHMAEHGWVRLPLDADGVPIHIGDVMDSKVDYLFDGRPFYVRALVLCEDGWDVADGRFGNRYEPNSLRHHHAPTVEDVLRDFGIDWEHENDCEDRAALLKEYAKRLTLAGSDAE